MKSFRPKGETDTDDPPSGGGRNPEVDFKGEKRSNETHESTTDPEDRLYRKGAGMEAKLCFVPHPLPGGLARIPCMEPVPACSHSSRGRFRAGGPHRQPGPGRALGDGG